MKTTNSYLVEDTSRARLQVSPEGMQAFCQAEMGLMTHWGLYSLSVKGDEWIYYRERIPWEVYRRRAEQFNPTRFQAEEWADLMLEAGFNFLLITSKHHDGFCLWDTVLTDFKVTNTPFRRDILRELAQALGERGIALHFYYSLLDWTHPAYRMDWDRYVSYYQNQVRELCSDYGKIGGILFDGYWPRNTYEGEENEWFAPRGAWDLAGTYDLIHTLQPDAVITNNTHILPLPGEDYQVSELDLPGENTAGFNTTEVGDKPTATLWNLNAGWSYQPWNYALKSPEGIVRIFRVTRERGAVFILNVGPRPFGDIHPEEQAVLRKFATLRQL
jgi:alpha-L-fucosidase